jgi:predicted dithiol-disulfide oxidoreductase (DUF899 family)
MERNMSYQDNAAALTAYRAQITDIRRKMREIQATVEPELVSDYTFTTPDGTIRLSDLFGEKNDLFIIHNMGQSCPACTLWADGYNGIYDHLANRAAFVLSTPDAPDVQRRFAAGRGWRFPMVSHQGTTFATDMGYRSESGGWWPGVSVFRRDGGRILRVSDTGLRPGDDFCSLWHFLDMLPEGAAGWSPRFSYE